MSAYGETQQCTAMKAGLDLGVKDDRLFAPGHLLLALDQ
jgi:hypothetical protein